MAELQSRIIFREGKTDNRGPRVVVLSKAGRKRGTFLPGLRRHERSGQPSTQGRGLLTYFAPPREEGSDIKQVRWHASQGFHPGPAYAGFRPVSGLVRLTSRIAGKGHWPSGAEFLQARSFLLFLWRILDNKIISDREDVRHRVGARADERVVELIVDHAFQCHLTIINDDVNRR